MERMTKTQVKEAEIVMDEVIDLTEKKTKEKGELKVINDNGVINLDNISSAEMERYSRLNSSLVVTDINSISNYGADLQNTMGKYSNDFLTAVRGSNGGEIGELINNLLGELNYIDVDELKAPSTFQKFIRNIPILNKLVANVEKMLHKYDSITKNIDSLTQKITATRLASLRDNNALQSMFENNIAYGKQIEDLIIAGKIKSEEVKKQLAEMQANADQYESHEIQDVMEFQNNLDRRLNDLLMLRYVIKQSLPQIRTVQYNNIAVADKAQTIIATTIPVWKNQLSIAVALHNQQANIEAHRKVTDTTNLILKKNAEMLRQNSSLVAKENERSVVDIETLRTTTQQLIETIREVKEIHEQGALQRKAAEDELVKIETELNTNMIGTSSNAKTFYLPK
jgi:uncharacterized protein YaaN involved in tellurite resistance